MWGPLARFLQLLFPKCPTSAKGLAGKIAPEGQLVAVRYHSAQPIELQQVSVSDAMSPSDSMIAARATGSQIDAVRLTTLER
jgi:hypothetical protein